MTYPPVPLWQLESWQAEAEAVCEALAWNPEARTLDREETVLWHHVAQNMIVIDAMVRAMQDSGRIKP